MPTPSRLNLLLTSGLALATLQVFIPTVTAVPTLPAQAGGSVQYQPPKRNTPQRTEGTGVRSSVGFQCATSPAPLFIATIAPTTHVGETIAARPTLYAYFTGTEAIEVRVRPVGSLKPLWKQVMMPPQPGFVAIPYPGDAPELAIGKAYQWSVEVVCDPKRPARNQGYTLASLTRVEAAAHLTALLEKATTAIDKAQVYANQSLWYEAIDTLASASLSNPKDAALRNQLIELLEQGGLTKAAKQARDAQLGQTRTPQSKTLLDRIGIVGCGTTGSTAQSPAQSPIGTPSRGPSERTRCP